MQEVVVQNKGFTVLNTTPAITDWSRFVLANWMNYITLKTVSRFSDHNCPFIFFILSGSDNGILLLLHFWTS